MHRGPRQQPGGDTLKDSTKIGFAKWVGPFIAILYVAIGVFLVFSFLAWKEVYPTWDDRYNIICVLSLSTLIVGGIIIFFLRHSDAAIVVGAGGVVLGLAEIFNEGAILFDTADMSSIPRFLLTAITAVMPMLEFILIVLSIRYMQGHRRNAMRMSICVILPAALLAVETLWIIAMDRDDFEKLGFFMTVYFPHVLLFCGFFAVLMSKGIKEDLPRTKVYKQGLDMYSTTIVSSKSTLHRDDLVELDMSLGEPEKWTKSEVFPNAKEYSVTFGENMNLRKMTFRKIDGADAIRVSIVGVGEKSYIQATRFEFVAMMPIDGGLETCSAVRFFGTKGFFIDISIRDEDRTPKEAHTIDRMIFGTIRKAVNLKSGIRDKKEIPANDKE